MTRIVSQRAAWLIALLMLGPAAAAGQTMGEPLRLTAFAVNMSNIGAGSANVVDINIERWSTDEERQNLITTFLEKGDDALLSALLKTKRVGYMRLPNSLGYDLHYAREFPLEEGGRRIIIMTDRHIGFREARQSARTMDYPFTLVEIRLNKDGEGQGKMSIATKITHNKKENTIELENYASEPVRLTTVKVEKK